jgi:hypothetical protein
MQKPPRGVLRPAQPIVNHRTASAMMCTGCATTLGWRRTEGGPTVPHTSACPPASNHSVPTRPTERPSDHFGSPAFAIVAGAKRPKLQGVPLLPATGFKHGEGEVPEPSPVRLQCRARWTWNCRHPCCCPFAGSGAVGCARLRHRLSPLAVLENCALPNSKKNGDHRHPKEMPGVLIPEWLTPADDGVRISSYALCSALSEDRDMVVCSGNEKFSVWSSTRQRIL